MEKRKESNLTLLRNRIRREIPEIALKFAEKTENMLLVGGALRDIVFGRTPFDFDFVISNIEEAREFFRKENIKFFVLKKGDFTFLRVILNEKTLDFIVQKKPITEDISDRDFTINTIYYNVKTGDLIGSSEAFSHIENKILRVASEGSVEKDSVRALRGVRFAAKFRLKIEKETSEKIKQGFRLLGYVSADRKHEESRKLFNADFSRLCIVFSELFENNKQCEEHEKRIAVCGKFGLSNKHISKNFSLENLCKALFICKKFGLSPEIHFGLTERERAFLNVLENAKCDFDALFEIFYEHGADFAVAAAAVSCGEETARKVSEWRKVKIDGNALKEKFGVSGRALGEIKKKETMKKCREIYEKEI